MKIGATALGIFFVQSYFKTGSELWSFHFFYSLLLSLLSADSTGLCLRYWRRIALSNVNDATWIMNIIYSATIWEVCVGVTSATIAFAISTRKYIYGKLLDSINFTNVCAIFDHFFSSFLDFCCHIFCNNIFLTNTNVFFTRDCSFPHWKSIFSVCRNAWKT